MSIQWGKRAEKQFLAAIGYIRQDLELYAKKVGQSILKKIESIPHNPERFGIEKYKLPNDGTYRYFNQYQYRISFRVQKNVVKIIRIRHQKRKPSFIR